MCWGGVNMFVKLKGKCKSLIILQILILFMFVISSLPVATADTPKLPLLAEGTIHVNGEPALEGTEIVVMLDGQVISNSVVEQKGIYGESSSNVLLIPAGLDNYGDLEILVNGMEAEMSGLELMDTASPGDKISDLNIVASNQNNLPAISTIMCVIAILVTIALIRHWPKN